MTLEELQEFKELEAEFRGRALDDHVEDCGQIATFGRAEAPAGRRRSLVLALDIQSDG